MKESDELRSLKRGLRCLNLLNQCDAISVSAAARTLNVPRTTAERLLATLQTEGYVRRGPGDKNYRLTRKVYSLSHGFNDLSLINGIAAPLLYQTTAEIGWPIEVAGVRGENVVALVATDDATALKIGRRTVGFEFPMIQCSAGLVYLAFLKPVERQAYVSLLTKTDEFKKYWGGDIRRLDAAVDLARQRGYAVGFEPGVPESSLSVPIIVNGSIKAILAMVYMTRAITDAQVVKTLYPRIAALSKQISDSVAAELTKPLSRFTPTDGPWSLEGDAAVGYIGRHEARLTN